MNSTVLLSAIPALLPRDGSGHQFVCYADSCSGVPGAPEEATFAQVNAVVERLQPQPQFICFPGDEIIGLSADEVTLRAQWRHWFAEELKWLDRKGIPLYHTTGNHTAYDKMSESVFRDVLGHLPRNGPPGQEGLAYFVRRDDLLLVFVNTLWSGFGGEGHVEIEWLERTLTDNADALHKLVFGHHPVHPIGGRVGPHELTIAPDDGRALWDVLVKHQVLAYICSHLLTYDVQVHEGVLQILTAGAGRAHDRLHCLQAALDSHGLRYQVLNTSGSIESVLEWPLSIPPTATWEPFVPGTVDVAATVQQHIILWCLSGVSGSRGDRDAQTLMSGWDDEGRPSPVWVGLLGRDRRFAVLLSPAPGRSPRYWLGPVIPPNEPFSIQLAFHGNMGPGGVLWRMDDKWSSLETTSSQGLGLLSLPRQWCVGHDKGGVSDRPFLGHELRISWCGLCTELWPPAD